MNATEHDHRSASLIAALAGERLMRLRSTDLGAADLKSSGDAISNQLIMEELAQRFPEDAILSEEAVDDAARLDSSRVWIVDPLDGTREFSEPPRTDWAVHVALSIDGVVQAGAVALPARGLTLATGQPLPERRPFDGRPRVLVSRTRPTEHARSIAGALDGELVAMGSAGAKAMAVVLGQAEIYAHSGGQYEWDSAAPVAVAAAAGLHTSRLDGSSLRYNRADPWLPDLLVCLPEFAQRVIDVCREA